MNDASDGLVAEQLPRMRRRIAWSFGLAWLCGLGVLLGVALFEGGQRRSEQLDRELALRATVVYGLSEFEPDGTMRHELLDREPWTWDEQFPMRAFAPEHPPRQLWGPEAPPELLAGLTEPIDAIVSGQEEWLGDIAGWRTYAIPLLGEHGDQRRGVAVVARSLSSLRSEKRRYSGALLGVFFGLAVIGIGISWRLAANSVRPLAEVLDSRVRFIKAAAHELRTPLTTVRAISESGRAGDEHPDVALRRIEALSCKASARVDTLLWHARLEAGAAPLCREPTRIDLLLDTVLADFPEATLDAEAVVAEVDARLLEVALVNLVSNAERHAPAPGGRGVEVGVGPQHVWVRDHGPGLPPEILEADRAVRSQHPDGHGLGLSVARMVATLHGGHLKLGNDPDGGARVELWWSLSPRRRSSAPEARPAATTPSDRADRSSSA